jgi:hypothetical protein
MTWRSGRGCQRTFRNSQPQIAVSLSSLPHLLDLLISAGCVFD